MMRFVSCILICFLTVSVHAQNSDAIAQPDAPTATLHGQAGNQSAAYWVVAVNAQGYRTGPSQPAVVTNLPDALSDQNFVRIQINPVKGASRYMVLKTVPMGPVKNVQVQAEASGERTVYYWVQWCNMWRQSAWAGPFAIQCNDPEGNVISWDATPNATWYNVLRTDEPKLPIGRTLSAVGIHIATDKRYRWTAAKVGPTRYVDPGRTGQFLLTDEVTDMQQPPLGDFFCLVGKSDGQPVDDKGQLLDKFVVANTNATQREPLTTTVENQGDDSSYLGSQILVRSQNKLKHLPAQSFGPGSHLETLVVENNFESGGHSEYHLGPGHVDWKSWSAAIAARSISHASSQHGSLTSYLRTYGGGDSIPLMAMVHQYGTNNDDGDEGAYVQRNSTYRHLESFDWKLIADAPAGSSKLQLQKLTTENGGTERLIVNLSKSHSNGRIIQVDNVRIVGRDTQWTPAMRYQWISFDVDTIDGKYRMWYWITDVASPTELTILAKTGWSTQCNLGYSRFIWDPQTMTGPKPSIPNMMSIRKLPDEHTEAAKQGKYVICPGTQLADPWHDGNVLNVEPLIADWHAGDHVRMVAGPQTYASLARFMMHGKVLPQDMLGGIKLYNTTNRPTNAPAIAIGSPSMSNFSTGVEVTLPPDGSGDGIVIQNASTWAADGSPTGHAPVHRAAVVVPDNVPAISGPYPWRYPVLSWQHDSKGHVIDAMRIGSTQGQANAMFYNDGKTDINQLNITGSLSANAQVRGVAELSGITGQKQFNVAFGKPVAEVPVVTFNTNQFERCRMVNVDLRGFTVEFEDSPQAGENNIKIWWIAIQ
jgi:hypothetical protein